MSSVMIEKRSSEALKLILHLWSLLFDTRSFNAKVGDGIRAGKKILTL